MKTFRLKFKEIIKYSMLIEAESRKDALEFLVDEIPDRAWEFIEQEDDEVYELISLEEIIGAL